MTTDPLLLLCAIHSLFFAAFHAAFWNLFQWPRTLAPSGTANSAITQILNLRLTYIFLAIGALCLAFPNELRTTPMGKAILAGMALFWIGRTIEQFVFLRIDKPAMHALTALFVIGAVLFALPLFSH